MPTYQTRGARVFTVTVNGDTVTVTDSSGKLVKEFKNPHRVHVYRDRLHGSMDGAFVVVETKPQEAVYVGEKVYCFQPDGPIERLDATPDYLDDVIYGWAETAKSYYALEEGIRLDRDVVSPYVVYYLDKKKGVAMRKKTLVK